MAGFWDVSQPADIGPDPFQQQVAQAGGYSAAPAPAPPPPPAPPQGLVGPYDPALVAQARAAMQQPEASPMGLAAAADKIAAGGPPPGIAPGQPGGPPIAPRTAAAAPATPQVPAPVPAPAPRPVAGGGVGGFGKLQKKVEEDQKSLMGSYGREEEDAQRLADATVAKQTTLSEAQSRMAAQQQAMALAQQERDQDAAMRLQTWRDQSMKYSQDLRAQKLDPNRYMANQSTGAKIGMIGGGILGGILSAWQGGGENQYIKFVNGEIDKDIRAQQEQYERGKDFLKQRDSVYAQMVQATGDQRLASMQVRQSLLESAKMDIEAQAQKLQIPEIQARAKQAITAIDREQKQLGMQWDQHALTVAQQQAAAAQAQRVAQEKMLHERMVEMTKLGQEQQKIDIEREKAGAGKKLTEQQQAQVASDEFNKQIDNALKAPVLSKLGYDTAIRAKFGQRLAPESSKAEQDLASLNTQILNAIGATAKDAEGKPSQSMLQIYEERFRINPTDTPEIARAKLQGARQVVNALGRRQGANAPEPNAMPASLQLKE